LCGALVPRRTAATFGLVNARRQAGTASMRFIVLIVLIVLAALGATSHADRDSETAHAE
jgi:hypothetical protein